MGKVLKHLLCSTVIYGMKIRRYRSYRDLEEGL